MAEPHEYVDEFREEIAEQAQPDNLPKLVVPAIITGFALALARRVL